jgi:hypothetical protein
MDEVIILLIPAILIVTVFILFILYWWRMNKEKKAGFVVKDERTARVEGKAAQLAIMASLYFMLGLLYYVFVANHLKFGLPPVETEWVLIISLIFTIGAYVLLKLYLGRKGDMA